MSFGLIRLRFRTLPWVRKFITPHMVAWLYTSARSTSWKKLSSQKSRTRTKWLYEVFVDLCEWACDRLAAESFYPYVY